MTARLYRSRHGSVARLSYRGLIMAVIVAGAVPGMAVKLVLQAVGAGLQGGAVRGGSAAFGLPMDPWVRRIRVAPGPLGYLTVSCSDYAGNMLAQRTADFCLQ
jgi:hypothetical protein